MEIIREEELEKHADAPMEDRFPDDELLLCECREALFRLEHPCPPAQEEWRKLEARITRRKRLRRSLTLAAVSLAAACVGAVLLVLWPHADAGRAAGGRMAVIVESETEASLPVIEETAYGKDTETIPLPAGGQAKKARGGAILTRQEADYTSVAGNAVCQNVVSIPRGNVYKITLNDGTEVWLNASSRLFFPTRFTGACRTVRLEGEAYFKVAPDKRHPFVIQTEKMSTEVLGTEFNVKAYPGSDAHVTLVSGSVKVHLPQMQESVVLCPGDDMACSDGRYSVQQVDISYYVQWMEGYFYYDDVLLTDILKDLGRWYNVTISMEQDSFLMSQRLHFVADRNEDISQAVENLNKYPYLSVSEEENKIVIRRKHSPAEGTLVGR